MHFVGLAAGRGKRLNPRQYADNGGPPAACHGASLLRWSSALLTPVGSPIRIAGCERGAA